MVRLAELRHRKWFIPGLVVCVLLLSYFFRYQAVAEKSTNNYVTKWVKDRWTGIVWSERYVASNGSVLTTDRSYEREGEATMIWWALFLADTVWLWLKLRAEKRSTAVGELVAEANRQRIEAATALETKAQRKGQETANALVAKPVVAPSTNQAGDHSEVKVANSPDECTEEIHLGKESISAQKPDVDAMDLSHNPYISLPEDIFGSVVDAIVRGSSDLITWQTGQGESPSENCRVIQFELFCFYTFELDLLLSLEDQSNDLRAEQYKSLKRRALGSARIENDEPGLVFDSRILDYGAMFRQLANSDSVWTELVKRLNFYIMNQNGSSAFEQGRPVAISDTFRELQVLETVSASYIRFNKILMDTVSQVVRKGEQLEHVPRQVLLSRLHD